MDWEFFIGFFCGTMVTLIGIVVFGLYIAAQEHKAYSIHPRDKS